MKRTLLPSLMIACLTPLLHAHEYAHHDDWIKPSAEKIGDGHGEIAVAENGEVYLSVGTGEKAGLCA